jgi:nucleoporin NUP1
MSGLPVSQRQSDNLFDTPSRQLTGPSRPSSNPRTHSQPPYARPGPSGLASSGRGLNGSPSYTLNGRSSLNLSAASGPQRIRNLTSSSATKSTGGGGLTRSGSESSLGLIGGLKSILSKPFNWLGTPAKQPNGQKRDFEYELESSGQDQMDLSPTAAKHAPKRARRRSPTPPTGPYSPAGKNENGTLEVTGRAVSGFMLPPLPPNVSLQPSRSTRLQQPTNFSRPLTTSHSMPYLDPPLGSPSRNRALGRSRRVDLAAIANGEVEVEDDQRVVKRVEGDNWTAWRSAAMSPPRSTASLRGQPSRDSADVSTSPPGEEAVMLIESYFSPPSPLRLPSVFQPRLQGTKLSRVAHYPAPTPSPMSTERPALRPT